MSETGPGRLPRPLHPAAWWLWALGLAFAASRTTNPLLLVLIVTSCGIVVAARRGRTPWGLAFRWYLLAGAVVVALRVAVRVLVGAGSAGPGTVVLLHLPVIPLPGWTSGLSLLGPVTADELLAGLYDGLRLATMLVCVGAANALANPKRLLKTLPPALHELATAVVVALSVFPQLAESVVRVRRARQLRGTQLSRGSRWRSIAVPVLEDALARSLLLAAAMDARGYGRRGDRTARSRSAGSAMLLLGVAGMAVGAYGLLDTTTPAVLQWPALAVGVAAGTTGLAFAGRSVRRTRYAPDRWRLPELLTVAAGVVPGAAVLALAAAGSAALTPAPSPPIWPSLPLLPTLAILCAALPAVLAPPAAAPTVAPDAVRARLVDTT